jgi:hypothetical protein
MTKCQRCKAKIETDLKPIRAMCAIARVYNPNYLCKKCREDCKIVEEGEVR